MPPRRRRAEAHRHTTATPPPSHHHRPTAMAATRSSLRMHLMAILWPSFLMAGVLEMLVFALVDPASLRWMGGGLMPLSSSAVYTLAFFTFWAVIALAGLLTRLLEGSADDINRDGASGAFRH